MKLFQGIAITTNLINMVLPTPENPRIIALFDVDGTLTIPRGEVEEDMMETLKALRKKITVGIVGGSDLPKQEEQLGDGIVDEVVWNFSQNGLVAYNNGQLLESNSISKFLGEDNIKRIVNWVMKYLSDLDLPIKVRTRIHKSWQCFFWIKCHGDKKVRLDCISHFFLFVFSHRQRGTFIEFRSGMLNISPIGRNCSRAERNDYEKFDLANNIRKNMVAAMKAEFSDLDMTYSIGGQISFDVFPTGWDKTYCLQYLKDSDFDEIHFFGDKTFEGGNDYEIFTSDRTIGHTVTSPEDTMSQLNELFLK